MRTLKNKSRVWCKTTKHFTDSPYHSSDGNFLLWHHTNNLISLNRIDGLDNDSGECDYIINRYCEFDDNGGKEIYEDDLVTVKIYGDWDDNEPMDVTYLIKWSFIQSGWRGFTKSMMDNGGTNRYSGMTLGIDRKIIGNIHENIELYV